MMAEKRWARTIALAPLLLAAVCWSMLAAPASSQCTDDHQGCNFYTSQRVYERSFPTWMYLGMPLVIQSEYDTEVRMVEREDVQTQHCFTHCEVVSGEDSCVDYSRRKGAYQGSGKGKEPYPIPQMWGEDGTCDEPHFYWEDGEQKFDFRHPEACAACGVDYNSFDMQMPCPSGHDASVDSECTAYKGGDDASMSDLGCAPTCAAGTDSTDCGRPATGFRQRPSGYERHRHVAEAHGTRECCHQREGFLEDPHYSQLDGPRTPSEGSFHTNGANCHRGNYDHGEVAHLRDPTTSRCKTTAEGGATRKAPGEEAYKAEIPSGFSDFERFLREYGENGGKVDEFDAIATSRDVLSKPQFEAQTGEFEFEKDACAIVITVTALHSESTDASWLETLVGVWDPQGSTHKDGIGVGRTRSLAEDEGELIEFASGSPEGTEKIINPHTQSPRGSLYVGLGINASTAFTHLVSLGVTDSDDHGDPSLVGEACRQGCGGSSDSLRSTPQLVVAGATCVMCAMVLHRRSTLMLALAVLLVTVPLTAAPGLCGCPRKVDVTVSVPRGFSFADFSFAGSGRIACSNCGLASGADYSSSSAPYSSHEQAEEAQPEETNPDIVEVVPWTLLYFDPRYFMARPLRVETDRPVEIRFKSHGTDELDVIAATDFFDATRTTNRRDVDGETFLYIEKDWIEWPIAGPSRASYVSIRANREWLLPSADEFLISVGAPVPPHLQTNHTKGGQDGAVMRLGTPQPLAYVGALVGTLCMGMHGQSSGVAALLLFGLTACWAQTHLTVVTIDMPTGLCFPEIVGLDDPLVQCPDCADWACRNGTQGQSLADQARETGDTTDSWLDELRDRLNSRRFELLSFELDCQPGTSRKADHGELYSRGLLEIDTLTGGFTGNGKVAGCVLDDGCELNAAGTGIVCICYDGTQAAAGDCPTPCPDGHYTAEGGSCEECAQPWRCGPADTCNNGFVGQGCTSCPELFYQTLLPDVDSLDGQCVPCPSNGSIRFDSTTDINVANSGCAHLGCVEGFHMRMVTMPDGTPGECEECPYPSRCASQNLCHFNFTGVQCAVCPPRFYQQPHDDDHPDGSCDPCPSPTFGGYLMLAVGVIGAATFFVLMTTRGSALTALQDKTEELQDKITERAQEVEELVRVIKSSLSYLQVLVMFFGAEALTMPIWMARLGQQLKAFAFIDIGNIFGDWAKIPADCVLATDATTLEDVYWNRFLSAQVLFWVGSCVGCIAAVGWKCAGKGSQPVLPNFKNIRAPTPLAVVGTIYSTLYIALLFTAARGVDCNNDDLGVSRLDDFPQIMCWTGNNRKYQALSAAMVVLYISIWGVTVVWNGIQTRRTDPSALFWTQEGADYAKKTVLTLTLVFVGKNPWLSYAMLVVLYFAYFVISYKLTIADGKITKDEKVAISQALGETVIAVFSWYFIVYPAGETSVVTVEAYTARDCATLLDDEGGVFLIISIAHLAVCALIVALIVGLTKVNWAGCDSLDALAEWNEGIFLPWIFGVFPWGIFALVSFCFWLADDDDDVLERKFFKWMCVFSVLGVLFHALILGLQDQWREALSEGEMIRGIGFTLPCASTTAMLAFSIYGIWNSRHDGHGECREVFVPQQRSEQLDQTGGYWLTVFVMSAFNVVATVQSVAYFLWYIGSGKCWQTCKDVRSTVYEVKNDVTAIGIAAKSLVSDGDGDGQVDGGEDQDGDNESTNATTELGLAVVLNDTVKQGIVTLSEETLPGAVELNDEVAEEEEAEEPQLAPVPMLSSQSPDAGP